MKWNLVKSNEVYRLGDTNMFMWMWRGRAEMRGQGGVPACHLLSLSSQTPWRQPQQHWRRFFFISLTWHDTAWCVLVWQSICAIIARALACLPRVG